MSRPLDSYDYISIVEIVVWAFLLLGGVVLVVRHGAKASSGWRYLIILALARIIGSGLRLGTINDPTNISLYTGWQICNGLAVGPLVLIILGLLTRVFESINRQGHVVVKPLFQRGAQILMIAAVILLIVGGTKSTYTMTPSGSIKIDYSVISKAGMIVTLVVYAILVLLTFTAFRNLGFIAQGEHRIVLAAIASMPFLLVREIYGCYLILGDKTSSAWLLLGMAVVMEIAVAIICEAVGLTLDKVEPMPDMEMAPEHNHSKSSSRS